MNKHIWNYLLAVSISLICIFFPLYGLRAESASSLIEQGQKAYDLGQYISAYETWHKAENIYGKTGDILGVFGSRVNQSQALLNMGQYRNACKKVIKSFGGKDTVCDSGGLTKFDYNSLQLPQSLEVQGLTVLGESLRLIGNFDESLSILSNMGKDSSLSSINKSIMLTSMGNTLRDMGKREFYRKGSITLEHIGTTACLAQPQAVRGAEDYYRQSIDCYQQAVETTPNHPITIKTRLNQLGLQAEVSQWLRSNGGQNNQEQLVKWQKDFNSTILIQQIQDRLQNLTFSHDRMAIQINLAVSLLNADSPQWQIIKKLIEESLDAAENLGDIRSKSYALGTMGLVYEKQHDYSKAVELSRKSADLAYSIKANDLVYQWEWQTAKNLRRINKSNSTLSIEAYEKAVNALKETRGEALSINADAQFSLRDSVEPLYRELVDLKLQMPNPDLTATIDLIESLKLSEIEDFLQCKLLNSEKKKVTESNNAAIIYTVILENRLELIVKFPSKDSNEQLKKFTREITREKLERLIASARDNMEDSERRENEGYQEESELYQLLIEPIKKEIPTKVNTLIFVMDGALRNIPVAALYDLKNKQFLMDQYLLAYTPSLNIFGAKKKSTLSSGLLVGLTDPDLPNVKNEINSIKSHLPKSTELSGSNFTSQNFKNLISSNYYSVIHLATHGFFDSDPKRTYIKTTDGQINIDEIALLLSEKRKTQLNSLELLVLSACKTASGDQRATLGMAGAAIKSGANSTVASLWSVSDASTSKLMDKFYSVLISNNKITKAEALNTAQKLIRKEYSSAYHWAPFVLVGDWL